MSYNSLLLIFQTPNDDKLAYNALWGKLAAEILMQNWDAALEDLNKLKEVIDSSVGSHPSIVCTNIAHFDVCHTLVGILVRTDLQCGC